VNNTVRINLIQYLYNIFLLYIVVVTFKTAFSNIKNLEIIEQNVLYDNSQKTFVLSTYVQYMFNFTFGWQLLF
jgi:hypothetical protein